MLKAELKILTKLIAGRNRTIFKESEIPVVYRNPDKEKRKSDSKKSKYEASNYNKRMRQRRCEIRQICYNNFQVGKMSSVTLTFDPDIVEINMTDLDETHKEFDKFIKRMNHYFDDFIYIATFSRQRNGNWHYHMICNIDDTISEIEIQNIWKIGIVKKKIIDSEKYFKNMTGYLIKNLDDMKDELKGRCGYKRSRNAVNDITIDLDKVTDEQILDELCSKIIQSEKVWIAYTMEKSIGILKKYTDEETGDTSAFVDFDKELSDELKSKGYENLMIKSTAYSVDYRFIELLPPLKIAVRKKQTASKIKNTA